jgi:hypothetical protein
MTLTQGIEIADLKSDLTKMTKDRDRWFELACQCFKEHKCSGCPVVEDCENKPK